MTAFADRQPGVPCPSTALAYDLIADRWSDAAFNPTNGVAQHRHALKFLADPAPGWVLNVGCGCNTRFNPLFRAAGLEIEGIDLSGRMVELARAADPAVVLHHADICSWPLPRAYRFISAWDSIWHVRLTQQRALLLKLMAALEPGGVLLFTAGGLDRPGEHTDASMGPEVYYATLGIPALLAVIAESGCLLRHFEFDQHPHSHLCVAVAKPA